MSESLTRRLSRSLSRGRSPPTSPKSQKSHISQRSHSRSPSPPTQIYHPSKLPHAIPTSALVESVAGGAHYSGVRLEHETVKARPVSPERKPSHLSIVHDHKRALDDVIELFCCRPTPEIFERSWNKDAIFEDPLSKCCGFREYTAQWYAMPKLFSNSETKARRVLSSTESPNRLVFSQTQEYTLKIGQRKKVVESVVIIEFDEEDKIIRLVDQWGGKEPPSRFGTKLLRRASAKVTPLLVTVPKTARTEV